MSNWYVRISTAAKIVTAQPNYFSKCPKCKVEELYDLVWERRLGDPTVWGVLDDGARIPYAEYENKRRAGNVNDVVSLHSREHIKCPHCGTQYYVQVRQTLHPVADYMPNLHSLDGEGDTPPNGDSYNSEHFTMNDTLDTHIPLSQSIRNS